jgi:hypothetical protein
VNQRSHAVERDVREQRLGLCHERGLALEPGDRRCVLREDRSDATETGAELASMIDDLASEGLGKDLPQVAMLEIGTSGKGRIPNVNDVLLLPDDVLLRGHARGTLPWTMA